MAKRTIPERSLEDILADKLRDVRSNRINDPTILYKVGDRVSWYKRSFDTPEIGQCYLYQGKPVYITDGCVESGGRVSNWWSFKYINKDGTLGRSGGCYGYEFTEKISCKVYTKVEINWDKYQDLDF